MAEIRIFSGGLTMMRAAADYIMEAADAAMSTRGHFTIALSGGMTPKALYELMATDEYIRYIDWSFVRVFWSDERSVPPDHYDSNYRMAKEAMLEYVRIPVGNIYRIHGELEPQAAADEYEKTLRSYFLHGIHPVSERQPRFDLVLLGIGEDGHTASLFPNTDALNEESRWVMANYVEQLDTWRVTLTPAALNAAVNVLFLVTGENKADAVAQILEGEYQPHEFPAQLVQPEEGNVMWIMDIPAASQLRNRPHSSVIDPDELPQEEETPEEE